MTELDSNTLKNFKTTNDETVHGDTHLLEEISNVTKAFESMEDTLRNNQVHLDAEVERSMRGYITGIGFKIAHLTSETVTEIPEILQDLVKFQEYLKIVITSQETNPKVEVLKPSFREKIENYFFGLSEAALTYEMSGRKKFSAISKQVATEMMSPLLTVTDMLRKLQQ